MKIAYILYSSGVITGKSNGIKSQALNFKSILDNNDVECVLINNWDNYEWKSFDAIHIFGYDLAIYSFVKFLHLKNKNIFISPIIDSTKSYKVYKFASYNGISKLRLFSVNYSLRKSFDYVKGVCGRSLHEIGYFKESFSISPIKTHLIPLSYGVKEPSDINIILKQKEDFCLHISSLYQDRKNVKRLVQAAIKYNFKLVLAGSTGGDGDFDSIRKAIGDAKNISVLGFISEVELINLYSASKVFALPSLNEGVGIVAVDAAIYGCNIAITNIEGPKEYYPDINTVEIVDPMNIDDIGSKIVKLLNTDNDSRLHHHIKSNYSKSKISEMLIDMYSK